MIFSHPFHQITLFGIFLLSSSSFLTAIPQAIEPGQVAIIYRANDPESEELALHYARVREIPPSQLIALSVPQESTISRTSYERFIREPLIEHFDREIWWHRQQDPATQALAPVRNKIRVLLLMKGVPYKIKQTPLPKGENDQPSAPAQGQQDEASVDSELVYLGFSQYQTVGGLNNPYFKGEKGIQDPALAPLLFTCRIDGPSYQTCRRIIDDSIEVEKTGLWGMCYLDHALKGKNYDIGDQWLRNIARQNRSVGIPTVVEKTRDTFLTHYPMSDAAIYFGWYAHHVNGPLLNPRFKFKKGAIATHLHSFSASEIDNPTRHWTGPILTKGAAATVGNVWEPYLGLTHNFDILHDRLLQGYSLVEAAHMAIPVHSWQSIVIGDPLYRPFLVHNKEPRMATTDRDYRALRLAFTQWKGQPETFTVKLRTAAAKMGSGRIYEALGLRNLEENKIDEAKAFFAAASKSYLGAPDKLRQSLHLIDIHRRFREKEAALQVLSESLTRFQGIPEAQALIGLKNIIDPPEPPPVTPKFLQTSPQ